MRPAPPAPSPAGGRHESPSVASAVAEFDIWREELSTQAVVHVPARRVNPTPPSPDSNDARRRARDWVESQETRGDAVGAAATDEAAAAGACDPDGRPKLAQVAERL